MSTDFISNDDAILVGNHYIPTDPAYRLTYNDVKIMQEHYTPMSPSGMSQVNIFTLAEELSDNLEIDGSKDLQLLVEANGGRISYVDDEELRKEDGSIFVHKTRQFDIILPRYGYILRNRFTIAHELGHYVIHAINENSERTFARRYDKSPVEYEANYFAAGFLMPSRRFVQVAKSCNNNIKVLSAHFGVSEQAAEIRLKTLLGPSNG